MGIVLKYLDEFITLLERLAKIHKELILLLITVIALVSGYGVEFIGLVKEYFVNTLVHEERKIFPVKFQH